MIVGQHWWRYLIVAIVGLLLLEQVVLAGAALRSRMAGPVHNE